MGDDSQLDYDELKNEAQSVRDDQSINDERINPVRAEYEELKKTPEFKRWRLKQYELQKGHCAYCYRIFPSSKMQVDHIKPISHGGKNNYGNFVLARKHCNEDLKFASAFNRISYFRAKKKIRNDSYLKQNGYVPIKIYWRRPKWIPKNPYSDEDIIYDESIPDEQRNVWDFENPIAPVSIAKSISQDDVEDMSGFIAPESDSVSKTPASSSRSYGILEDVSEFITNHIVGILIIIGFILFSWYVASGGTWSFNNKAQNTPSSSGSNVPHFEESLNCGCGESLVCDGSGECHCVQDYICEDESLEDIYGDY